VPDYYNPGPSAAQIAASAEIKAQNEARAKFDAAYDQSFVDAIAAVKTEKKTAAESALAERLRMRTSDENLTIIAEATKSDAVKDSAFSDAWNRLGRS